MRIKAVTLGVVLAGTALGSAALSLGRARGAAWIGQPLELVVPVQIDPGQADGALCAEAEVFHGEIKQERAQVQVTATDVADTFHLKVNSSALVDEPVVTIYLSAGCTQKFSRKYVLLADYPTEAAAPQGLAQPKPVQKALTPSLVQRKELAKTEVPSLAKQAKNPQESTGKVEKPAEAANTADAGKPRLRLDPMEMLNERVKSLEANKPGVPPSEDAARNSKRMDLLQRDMKILLDQAAKNDASLSALRERLERAESDRVPAEIVYGLAALLLLCLAALALVWNKRFGRTA